MNLQTLETAHSGKLKIMALGWNLFSLKHTSF